jgi:ATP-dependent DNA ligase
VTLPQVQPVIPTLRKAPFDGAGWLFEVKYDGFRALCYLERGRARFVSRNGKPLARFAALGAEVAAELEIDEAVLDGEVIAADATGRPRFWGLVRGNITPPMWRLICCGVTVPICARCRWVSVGRRCGASCRRDRR